MEDGKVERTPWTEERGRSGRRAASEEEKAMSENTNKMRRKIGRTVTMTKAGTGSVRQRSQVK